MGKSTLALAALIALTAGACSSNQTTSPTGTAVALRAVSPSAGATGVAVTSAITLGFSGAMASGMEQFMDLHMGDLSGGTVPMRCAWSTDRETLTCTPLSPLMPHTTYTIHVGGGMMGANGRMVDYSPAQMMGGQWIMGGMMSGIHGGSMGWGMMGGD